jgi:hypothetical protein
MAYLNLADIAQKASSQSSPGTGNPNPNGQPQPGMQNGPN